MHSQSTIRVQSTYLFIQMLFAVPSIVNAQSGMYLQVAGVVGSVLESNHVGTSHVVRFEFGVEAPTALVRTPRISGLEIIKPVDAASVPFMNAAASGTVFPTATFEVLIPSTSGTEQTLLYFQLTNVRIVSIVAVGDLLREGLNEPAMETVEFQFDEITVTHPVFGPRGEVKNNLQFTGSTKER